MHESFWLQRWERGEIGFHQPQINPHLQRFWSQVKLSAGTGVFVPLCGKSLDMLWLAAQGHRVLGVEISGKAVEAFFRDHDLNPQVREEGPFRVWQADELTLLEGDFFDLAPAHLAGMGAIYDRASLIALPPAMRRDYARHLGGLLPEAPVLLVTLDYDQAQMEGPPFAVPESEVRELYSGAYRVELLYREDALADNPRFRERGLTRLEERIYRLSPLLITTA